MNAGERLERDASDAVGVLALRLRALRGVEGVQVVSGGEGVGLAGIVLSFCGEEGYGKSAVRLDLEIIVRKCESTDPGGSIK